MPDHFPVPAYDDPLPWLTREQMVEVDRLMVEEAGILLVQMMENAGRHLAHLARLRFLGGDPRGRTVVVLAGTGGNGGGALVAARRLGDWGARVRVVVTSDDARFAEVPRHQLAVARNAGLVVTRSADLPKEVPDLIVDGILGYGVDGDPRGDAATMIRWADRSGAPILALDAPSGLDATTGRAFEPALRATATLTLALPKQGLRRGSGPGLVGELYLADIGVPPALYASPTLRLEVPAVFARGDIVRLPGAPGSDCCELASPVRPAGERCADCGEPGRAVDPITVKALLRPEALARLSAPAHRFCATASCPVVYFGEGEAFRRQDVAVPVFQKEPPGNRTVCYCFAVSEADLRREIADTGRSTAAERITGHVQAGRCACELKNPQGSCCLGNVVQMTRALLARDSGAPTR